MNDEHSGAPVDELVHRFDFQSDWLDLTLDSVNWGEVWAVATVLASPQFDPAGLTVSSRKLIRDLRSRALDLNRDHSNLAAALYTPEGRVIADLRLDTYGEQGSSRPSPAEAVPLLLQSLEEETGTKPEVRHLSLDTGPVVRVRVELKRTGWFSVGRKRAAGLIRYAMFPPGSEDLDVVTVRWWRPEDAEEVARLADQLVATARLVPAGSGQSDAAPGSTVSVRWRSRNRWPRPFLMALGRCRGAR
ncbi:hypothetical protein [Streptomyces sp. NPDC003877]